MVTDYGTNAEMAIKVGDGCSPVSAAAGPAIEGQRISAGMLASPGAISDLVVIPEGWQAMVLNEELEPCAGSAEPSREHLAAGLQGPGDHRDRRHRCCVRRSESERIVLPRISKVASPWTATLGSPRRTCWRRGRR